MRPARILPTGAAGTKLARFLLLAAASAALAGCGREEQRVAQPAAPAASAATASASAPAAPAGPIIAPVSTAAPTQAERDSGAQLAAQGLPPAAPACNGCHGAQGEGNAATGFPRIAGQSRSYLLHELEAYAQGSRKHPVMQPIAAALNAQQRAAAATYYAALAPAGQAASAAAPASASVTASGSGSGSASTSAAASAPASASRSASASASASGRGAQLATAGDEALGVQGCANCHGPGGIGAGELYPYLAGQHAAYLTATLGAWRDGSRNDDPTGQMPEIAKALAPQDLAAVAAYYAAQPPRSTAIGAERMPSVAVAGAASVTSGPQVSNAATLGGGGSGQGSEQGAATTGGAQGPGGGGATGTASTGQPLAPSAGAASSGQRLAPAAGASAASR